MPYTKRQFIQAAFEELGMAEYAFDMSPEAAESALRRLDSLMAQWNGSGIRLGYPLPSTPDAADLDEVTGVPDSANEAVILNLAIRMGPSFGKTLNPATVASARAAYSTLCARASFPPQRKMDALPSGAGNKPLCVDYTTFIGPSEETLDGGSDGPIDLGEP